MEKYLGKILIVNEDTDFCNILENALSLEELRVESVTSGEQALNSVQKKKYSIVILDLALSDLGGIQVLNRIKEIDHNVQVIACTDIDTVSSAIESIRQGACSFITKPIMLDEVLVAVAKVIQKERRKGGIRHKEYDHEKMIIGTSQPIQEIKSIIKKVAPTDSTVLITGESGTGKEIIAHALFAGSRRNNKPFVKISCAALPETLLESELFGYLKGAFTGALAQKKGLFEVANGGTLFLDEISEVSPNIQAKLLRALQEREIKPVGSNENISIDVRFIAATNKDLRNEIAKGNFREDLFYRLNVINIKTTPLRNRTEDIPLLVSHFIQQYRPKEKKGLKTVDEEVMDLFTRYYWMGNIRELENVIERALVLGTGGTITVHDIPDRIRNSDYTSPAMETIKKDTTVIPALDGAVEELEKELIMRAMQKAKGIVSRAAKLLSIKRTTLLAKMKKLKLR